MDQQVVTELVIDSDTTGADQFSSAMDRASDSAQKGTTSAASAALAIAGVGLATIGVLAGLRSFVDYAGQQTQALVDIANHAAIAGVSTKEFQQTLFAARSQGLTDKDFVSGFDRIAADLQQAGQGVTQFSKLFEANGIAIKNQNGELISTKTALADIMQLMQGASPAVQAQLAKIVGLSADWIPFLKEGAAQFDLQKAAAENLGLVIEDSTIAKASEFNAQWKTAVATWDLQFKASIASILPLLTQLASLASQVISAVGAVSGTGNRLLTPDDDKTKSQLNDQINDAYRLREAIASLGDINVNTFAGFKARNLAGMLGLPEDATLPQVDALIDKLSALDDKKPSQLTVTPNFSTVLPPSSSGDSNDAVDRAINSLSKHIEQQNADTLAVGLGAAAQALFRAQATETSAVLANGGAETAKQAAAFAVLRDRAAAAADALARAKIAADIKFGANTAFLSQDDVAIATKLKDTYANVATALNSAEASQLRFNSAARQLSSTIENNLVTGLTDIATGAKGVEQGFKDLAITVLKSIEQMIIKIAIVQPMMAALQASVTSSGILGFLGIGSAAAGSSAASALAAGTAALHEGGIVGSEATFSRFVHPSYFDNAPRFHTGGIAGDEVPIIAKKGEGVFTPGQMAAMGGGSATNITYAPNIDARGADAQAVAKIAQVLSDDRKNFERNVQAVVAKTRSNNPGAFR